MKNHWILKNECPIRKPLGIPKAILKNECVNEKPLDTQK